MCMFGKNNSCFVEKERKTRASWPATSLSEKKIENIKSFWASICGKVISTLPAIKTECNQKNLSRNC